MKRRGIKTESGSHIIHPTENDCFSVGKFRDGRLAVSFNVTHVSTSGKDEWLSRETMMLSRDDARWIARELLRTLGEPFEKEGK